MVVSGSTICEKFKSKFCEWKATNGAQMHSPV